jgi:GrpB-like predicted nucleotidyltransferase (UPF0157 family)
MPTRADIVTFSDPPEPEGRSAWVGDAAPDRGIEIAAYDPAWPRWFDELAARIRAALGWRALGIEHVGSTSVPGLPAKPVIDIDLTVADSDDEPSYVPALEAAGFELRIREPWWYGHRLLRGSEPRCNLHVFGFESPELVRHRLFRDWLRGNPDEREEYARVKRESAVASNAAGEDTLQYNARKEQVVRDIYRRAFTAMGLLD